MDRIREQKEQEAIDELFPIFYTKMDYIRNRIKQIYEIKDRKDIFNVAILLNNKVVEIGQEFKRKDIGFYSEASLKSVILSKLFTYYEQACSELKAAVKIDEDLEEYFLEDDYDATKKNFNQSIENYKTHCNEIYSYSIEKNIIDDIIERYAGYKDKKVANENLEKYKKELVTLGYGHLLQKLLSQLEKQNNSFDEVDSER